MARESIGDRLRREARPRRPWPKHLVWQAPLFWIVSPLVLMWVPTLIKRIAVASYVPALDGMTDPSFLAFYVCAGAVLSLPNAFVVCRMRPSTRSLSIAAGFFSGFGLGLGSLFFLNVFALFLMPIGAFAGAGTGLLYWRGTRGGRQETAGPPYG